ncbi:MAG: peptidylprolyl isomerase [Opitutales bacterium]|jgi:peptidyl-prolyl cis-trans isomerase SurA
MTPRFAIFTLAAALGGLACQSAPLLAQDASASNTTTPGIDPAEAKYANGIAAVVNDKIITLDQVRKQVDPLVQRIYAEASTDYPDDQAAAAQYVHDELAKLFSDILHRMVDNILIIQAFNDSGRTIPKYFMDQEFDDSITNRFGGDREAFLSYLKQSNMSEREYRQQLQDDIIVDYMRSQLRGPSTGISPDRIVKYYNDHKQQFAQEAAVKVRQITLKPTGDYSADVLMQEAQDIVKQARAPGADFADLARKYSQDEFQSAGGEADWIPKGQYQSAIENVIFSLKPGQVSDPVAAGGNVYIFFCEDKRDAGIQPLNKVSYEIEDELAAEDARQAEEKWLTKLRKNAYIKYNM